MTTFEQERDTGTQMPLASRVTSAGGVLHLVSEAETAGTEVQRPASEDLGFEERVDAFALRTADTRSWLGFSAVTGEPKSGR